MIDKEVFARAAEHIRKVGLCRDGYYYQRHADPHHYESDERKCPACILGAIGVAMGGTWYTLSSEDASEIINTVLSKLGGVENVADWNDTRESAEPVIALLEELAK